MSGPAEHPPGFEPGLFLLQASNLEDLADTVLAWLQRNPPGVLEEDFVLVPSNALGEWFKVRAAQTHGLCAGLKFELPARFAWRITETVVGPVEMGAGRFEKQALVWWLLGMLTRLGPEQRPPGTLAHVGGAEGLSLNLADYRATRRVADLFDQYQIYRADWLADWQKGQAVLRPGRDDLTPMPIPGAQAWQASLWANLTASESNAADSRPARHQACLSCLQSGGQSESRIWRPGIPRRVVVVLCGHIPPQTLELLAALSRHGAVLLALLNPCQVQWADLSEAAEVGQPLLAAWGGQLRDAIRQLDRFEVQLERLQGQRMGRAEREDQPWVSSALDRLQAAIRLNEPPHLTATDPELPPLADGSVVLHVAHSPLREVEALHDHLLSCLEARTVQPHEIVVMVPDLERYRPAIQAVFGRFQPDDERMIPWGLGDRPTPDRGGVGAVLDWLLSLPMQRATLADWSRLGDCSSLRRRWSLDDDDIHQLQGWLVNAGLRWGLDSRHRAALGLEAAGEVNTWRFAARRMLAGLALGGAQSSGHEPHAAGVAPMASVQGLSALAAGAFSSIARILSDWQIQMQEASPAAGWVQRIRHLLHQLVDSEDESDGPSWAAFERALSAWSEHTQALDGAVLPWSVVHESLMQIFVEPSPDSSSRFQAPGVTFCTLMPMRAVPFGLVCLLGMNDGDYPRASHRSADDLMVLPGMARPGDRARRSDDRQLMLDALMSARQQLLVSWCGRAPQDNQVQVPSILVGQLLDCLASIWGQASVNAITVEFPLQPFSSRYFDPASPLQTYAREWEPLHPHQRALVEPSEPTSTAPPDPAAAEPSREDIERWLIHPVASLVQNLLEVKWPRDQDPVEEDEVLALNGLQSWALRRRAANARMGALETPVEEGLLGRVRAEGRLPLGAPGLILQENLQQELAAWLSQLNAAQQSFEAAGARGLMKVVPSNLRSKSGSKAGSWRDELLVPLWWQQLQATIAGEPDELFVVAADGAWRARAPSLEQAKALEAELRQLWRVNHQEAVPWPADARAVDAPHGTLSAQIKALNDLAERDPAWRRVFGVARDWSWVAEQPAGFPYSADIASWQHATDRLYTPYRGWRDQMLDAWDLTGAGVAA